MATAYRADNVGSLRARRVARARAAHEQGHLTLAQLRQSEDTAILQALELQRQVGLDVCTDGEYRRAEFRSVFDQAVEGLVPGPAQVRSGPGPETVRPSMVIGARIRQVRRLTAHESHFLRQHAGSLQDRHPSRESNRQLILAAGCECTGLYRRVCPVPGSRGDRAPRDRGSDRRGAYYIQIDAPRYTYFVDERWRQRFRDRGEDPDVIIDEWIAADNASW